LEVQYDQKIEENPIKMAMMAPRWDVFGDFGVMLRHVGSKWRPRAPGMSQHGRQGANPLGF